MEGNLNVRNRQLLDSIIAGTSDHRSGEGEAGRSVNRARKPDPPGGQRGGRTRSGPELVPTSDSEPRGRESGYGGRVSPEAELIGGLDTRLDGDDDEPSRTSGGVSESSRVGAGSRDELDSETPRQRAQRKRREREKATKILPDPPPRVEWEPAPPEKMDPTRASAEPPPDIRVRARGKLSAKEAESMYDPLVRALEATWEMLDNGLELATGEDVKIWRHFDREDNGRIAEIMIHRGQRTATVANMVRTGAEQGEVLELVAMIVPKAGLSVAHVKRYGIRVRLPSKVRREG